jgi:hypothetical protein
MPRKRYKPEEIVAKLRQVVSSVLSCKGNPLGPQRGRRPPPSLWPKRDRIRAAIRRRRGETWQGR